MNLGILSGPGQIDLESEFAAQQLYQQNLILDSTISKIIIGFVVTLLLVFLLWCLFKGLIYNYILKKRFTLSYYLKFIVLNLIWSVFWIILFFIPVSYAYKMLEQSVTAGSFTAQTYAIPLSVPILLALMVIIMIHLTTVLYISFTKNPRIFSSIKKTFFLGIGKFHKFIVPYIFVAVILILLSFINLIFAIFPETAEMILSSIFLLVFIAWFRFYLIRVIDKLEKTMTKRKRRK